MVNGRDELMREPDGTLQIEVLVSLAESPQCEPVAWNPPTLKTWKIEEETMEPISGKVAADFGG
jgi:hypothetical protein